MSAIERLLEHDGYLVYKTRGTSMEPMLRQGRDLVVVRVPSARLSRYDVALYRRGGAHVLHRVIGVADDHYLIRGDNTYAIERVPDEAVIGVLSEFRRKGRQVSTTDAGYRLYARLWDAIYPVRLCCVTLRRAAGRLARRAGILAAAR